MKRSFVGTLAVIALLGCSTAEPSASSEASTNAPSSVAATSSPDTTTTALPSSATTASSLPTTTAAPTPAEPYFTGADLQPILVRSPGAGPRPLLVWEAVEGAAVYSVLVLDPEGTPWWAWSGVETEVVLGGVDTTAEIGGPTAQPGTNWVVFAYDPDGNLIGASPLAEVSG